MKSILNTIKFEDEANQDASLFNVISNKHGKDMTRFFWGDLMYRVYSNKINNFFCIFIWGEQGTAKSGIGQVIHQTIFPDFCSEYVAFSDEELRRIMNEIPPFMPILRDEFQEAFGDGSHQLRATTDNYTRQLRERGNSFIYIQPDFTDMKNFHYYLRTIHFDEVTKEVIAGLQNPMTNGYMGYVRFNLQPYWNNKLWMDYKAKKKLFVEKVATNMYDKIDLTKIGLGIMDLEDFSKAIQQTKRGIKLDMGLVKNLVFKNSPNLTISQNNMIAQEIKMLFSDNKIAYENDIISGKDLQEDEEQQEVQEDIIKGEEKMNEEEEKKPEPEEEIPSLKFTKGNKMKLHYKEKKR